MITAITGTLVALKLAGIGSFSWWLPALVYIIGTAITFAIAHLPSKHDIGHDWNDRMSN